MSAKQGDNFNGLTLKLLKENLAMRAHLKNCPPVHIVAEGETLLDICRKYTGSAQRFTELLGTNPDLEPTLISPGQHIKLPINWVVTSRYTEEVFEKYLQLQHLD